MQEYILSILSVLEVRKVQTKASVKQEKNRQKHKKTSSKGKNPFLIFPAKTKKSEDENLVEKVISLRMLLLSRTVVRRVMRIVALAVTQEVVKVIAKTESNPVLRPYDSRG